jgi:peptide/nickel transport system substrate-binding protein
MHRREALRLLGLSVVALGIGSACQQAPAPAAKPAEAPKPTAAPAAAAPAKPAAPAAVAPTAAPANPAEAAKPAADAKPAAAPASVGKRGGTVRVGIINDAADLDPHGIPGGIERHILAALCDNLVTLTPEGSIAPMLATSWEPTSDLTWVFKLRQGVTFHDGTKFDAAAAKWNYDRMLRPEQKSPRASELLGVKSVDAVDEYTIRFNLEKPFAPLPYILGALPGMMVSPAAVEKAGKDFSRQPVAAGPFKFAEWVKDDHITLRRHDGYWGKDDAGTSLPYLDEIVYQIIPDNAVRLTNLKTGNIEIMNQISERDVAGLRSDSSIQLFERDSYGFHRITLNSSLPPFDNKALRQAFSATVDRDAIVKSLFFGVAKPSTTLFTPVSWAYDPTYVGQKRDLDLARKKLAEGGKPDGFTFKVEVGARRNDPQVMEAVQAQAAEVGIKMEIDAKDFALVVKSLNDHSFQAVYSTFNGNVDPDINFETFHSKSSKNFGLYNGGPRVDELFEQGRAVADQAKRKEIYQEIQRIVMEDAGLVHIATPTNVDGVATKMKNFVQYPDLALRLRSISY